MKKSTIGVVIVAVILIVIGIGLFIGGISAAGGVEEAKDAILESGIALSRVHRVEIDEEGLDIDLEIEDDDHAENHGTTASEKQQYSDMEEITFGIEDIKSIDLELEAAKVEITENASSKEFSVCTDGSYDIYVKNGVLHIKAKKNLDAHKMLLEMPGEIILENADISAGACEVDIHHIEAAEVDVEVGAGQVLIGNLVADEADFEIGAGEMIVQYGNIKHCLVSVGMGEFQYDGSINSACDVECSMGNAEFRLDESQEDFNYEIECAAGNVDIDGKSFSGLAAEKIIDNEAAGIFEIECSMGNVTVEF